MGFVSVLGFAQKLVAERLQQGEPAVDATMGTGVDTLFLAKLTGSKGRVYSFDIQREALERTRERLAADPAPQAEVRLIQNSHDGMMAAIPPEDHGRIAAVMFNLGYLPGADPRIITKPSSTLTALEAALSLLRKDGILTAVLYPGHAGGDREADAVNDWAKRLPQETYQVLLYRFANRPETTPYLLAVSNKQNVSSGRL